MRRIFIQAWILPVLPVFALCGCQQAQPKTQPSAAAVPDDRVRAENALWLETPPERRFHNNREVVVADINAKNADTIRTCGRVGIVVSPCSENVRRLFDGATVSQIPLCVNIW